MKSRNVLIKNRYIFFLLTITTFILFFFAVESSGSQTVYRSRTLEDLIRVSQYILVVKEAKPFFTVKEIDITPKGKEKNKRKYPPFEKRIFHYEVIETLYHGAGKNSRGFVLPAENESKSSIPKSIDVIQANMEERLELHILYYIDGFSESTIYKRYEPDK